MQARMPVYKLESPVIDFDVIGPRELCHMTEHACLRALAQSSPEKQPCKQILLACLESMGHMALLQGAIKSASPWYVGT